MTKMVSKTMDAVDSNLWLYENRPPLLIRGNRAILPQISALQNKSVIVLAAGVPSLPRREEIPTHPPVAKPGSTAAQKALIELRSLHGQKHALSLLHLQRSSTNAGVRTNSNEVLNPPSRGRKPFKSGLLKDSRNVKENETIKHLMHQLSELNNITYKREISGGSGSFCSEITLQSRVEDIPSASGKGLRPQTTKDYSTLLEEPRGIPKSHNVMKLIERQILRDLTRHIHRNSDSQHNYSSPDTKTHSDELPGEMKVVIKKTSKKGGKNSKSGDVTKPRRNDVTLPFITKTAPANMRRKRAEKYEWSLDEAQDGGNEQKTLLPTMTNTMRVQGQGAPPSPESTTPTTPSRKLKARLHGDNVYSGLPRIQEEPDSLSPLLKNSDRLATRDVGTSMSIKESSPVFSESPDSNKIKLPILGKSIGQQREVTSENGGKFIKPSIGEIKRIIHGLYGDYFDFTLDRYYTYENQFNEPKATVDLDTPLHFVTPALDESKTPAGSHTLQLFKSAKKMRGDESQMKVQKMSAPLLRSKYGKAIATINRSTERASSMAKSGLDLEQPDNAKTDQQIVDMDYMSFLRDQKASIVPNTPNERALRNHIAYQVALYHEQIARENSSLQQSHVLQREPNNSRYMAENNETTMTLAQFTEDIDRYALYLEAYLEAKKKQSEERKVKLLEFKKRQRKNKEDNRHLEIVENRDAFLAQVAISKYRKQMPKTPKTPANTLLSVKDSYESVEGDDIDDKCQESPVAKKTSKQEVSEEKQEPGSGKHAMGTKVYRIFGERQSSGSAIHRWVAQAPVTYSSRLIKKQVSQNTKRRPKPTALPSQTVSRIRGAIKPHVMTDFVSRFRVATKYKLDRQYVASLASGTM